jgi:hypothetical protein
LGFKPRWKYLIYPKEKRNIKFGLTIVIARLLLNRLDFGIASLAMSFYSFINQKYALKSQVLN